MSTTVPADVAAALSGGPADLYEVFRRKFDPGASPEDPAIDPSLLAAAERTFEDAAVAADAKQQHSEQGRALIGLACVHACTNVIRSLEEAERPVLQALHILSPASDGALIAHAYLVLLDGLVKVVDVVKYEDRERFVERALGFARAAEYVATRVGNDHTRAKLLAHECTLLGERFRGDRDQNLMDALDVGERALALVPSDALGREIRWPSLLLQMGNAAVKISKDREAWLRRANEHYARGRELVDETRYPGLAAVIDGNAAACRNQTEEQRRQLPPKEIYPRYSVRIDAASAAGDSDTALATASELMDWAYRLPVQPNQYVGRAHVTLGQLCIALARWSEACQQLEIGIAVLQAVFPPHEHGYRYVRSALTLHEQAVAGKRAAAS
jgi:hypothetical protein